MSAERTIAVACGDDRGLDSEVSAHFGRCPYYTLVRVDGTEIKKVETASNPNFNSHVPGAMPVFIRDLGADVILAGGMGPRAVQMFQSFGMEAATGALGRVGAVLEAYLKGQIKGTVPCDHDHPESCGGH